MPGVGRTSGTPTVDTLPSLVDCIAAELRLRGLPVPDTRDPEPLARLDYATEHSLKTSALRAFWRIHGLPGELDPLVAAPVPRGYRTTTKRRVLLRREGLALAFPGSPVRAPVAPSALDLPEHLGVYGFVHDQLRHPASAPLTETLNWVVVRGSAPALSVILNVRRLDGGIVRAAKRLSSVLEAAQKGVRSGSLFLDPSGSDYYLEADRPSGVLTRKRLFGPDFMEITVAGMRLRFPPTAFSQVNGSMVETMVSTARGLLSPLAGHRLLDLYCGYGLFALTIGGEARSVLGMDIAGLAIEAAVANASHLRSGGGVRFVAADLTEETLASRLPSAGTHPEACLLDPPRQGTARGVVAAIAHRRPERVLHVACGADEIPREVHAWARAGYHPVRIVPLDLFPGTPGLETFILLTPR